MGAGITATFIAGTGAAPAAMILFGSLFLVLALMKRVPLNLEVGGAKIDASYEVVDEAYTQGRDFGRQLGVEDALTDVEQAKQRGVPADEALAALRDRIVRADSDHDTHSGSATGSMTWTGTAKGHAPAVGGYRGPTACNAAGITYRQLDYWARTGLVEPSLHAGAQRLFSANDIVLLKVIKQLLDAGISLQQIRTAIHHIRERSAADMKRITLLSDGDSVYEATSHEEVIDLLESGRGMFGINLGGVVRHVTKVLQDLPSERASGAGWRPPEGGSEDQ